MTLLLNADELLARPPGIAKLDALALEGLAVLRQYDAGQPIYRCFDPSDDWYRVVTGAARASAVIADGQRRIVDFLFPGDLFGFGIDGRRRLCVEAIVRGTLVARYPRRSAERVADSDPMTARNIRQAAFDSVSRMQKHMVMIGRSSALERVSAFLLEMSDRTRIEPGGAVLLPMPRYDIADYLAMAVETVSRALTELRARHVIELHGAREITVCDLAALEQFANGVVQPQASQGLDLD